MQSAPAMAWSAEPRIATTTRSQKGRRVGDTLKPSIEKIIALRPQIVFVSTASQLESVHRGTDAHQISVYVTDAHDLEGCFVRSKMIAFLLDRSANADALLRQLRARVSAVQDKVSRHRRFEFSTGFRRTALHDRTRCLYHRFDSNEPEGVSVTADVPGAWPRYSEEIGSGCKTGSYRVTDRRFDGRCQFQAGWLAKKLSSCRERPRPTKSTTIIFHGPARVQSTGWRNWRGRCIRKFSMTSTVQTIQL